MASIPRRPRRVKPKDRGMRLLCGGAALELREGKVRTLFLLSAIPSDWGSAFRLTKVTHHQRGDGDDEYSVNIDGEGGTCECMGFSRHGHCRHVEALVTLAKAGRLPLPVLPASVPEETPMPEHCYPAEFLEEEAPAPPPPLPPVCVPQTDDDPPF